MTISKTLMATAAIVVLGTGAAMAEGSVNTDGTHNAGTVQTDTHMGAHVENGVANDTVTNAAPSYVPPTDTTANVDATANAGVAAQAPDAATVESVQASLKSEGHNVSVDGVWGPKTMAAVRDFQQSNGIPATGRLDSQTLAALDVQR